RRVGRIAAYPAMAVMLFLAYSRIVVGHWFVSTGFFVPENKAIGSPILSAAEIWWGVHTLSGRPLALIGAAGLVMLLVIAVSRARSHAMIPLSLTALAIVPWAAFVKGHPFRIRYMIPLEAVQAVGIGLAAGLIGPLRVPLTVLVIVCAAREIRPLDA